MKDGLKKYLEHARCCYCREKLTRLKEGGDRNEFVATYEHVIPRSKNGDNSKENLKLCCQRCNNLRGNMELEIFDFFARTVIHSQPLTPTPILRKSLKQFIESLAAIAVRNRKEANKAASHALLLIAHDMKQINK